MIPVNVQIQAVKTKLQKKGHDKEAPDKYADVDLSLKHYDKKLKEASLVQMGPRGNNKVSAIAEQLAGRNQEPEKPTIQRSVSIIQLKIMKERSSPNLRKTSTSSWR